jgi:hypothetical protein
MKKVIIGVAVLAAMFVFMSWYTVDLLPSALKGDANASENKAKAKAIFEKSWKAHGVDSLKQHEVYQLTTVDDWKGPMAGMGKLWAQKNTNMLFKYVPNTFDAQVEFLNGETKGMKAGLQSWKYYEQAVGSEIEFKDEANVRYRFGMAAYQYFTETVSRLSNAEFIRFAGTEEFNGSTYDLVYATWGSMEGNDQHDQYILYFNQETNMLDYATYTVRDNYLKMPGGGMMYATMRFNDYRNIDGFQVPFEQTVFMFGPQEDKDNYIHKLTLSSFEFDGFDKAELYPDPSIALLGDSK